MTDLSANQRIEHPTTWFSRWLHRFQAKQLKKHLAAMGGVKGGLIPAISDYPWRQRISSLPNRGLRDIGLNEEHRSCDKRDEVSYLPDGSGLFIRRSNS